MLNERQMSILTYITEHGEAKNTALQSLIGDCSMMTLWRDLTKLEQEGRIIRVRGGAIAAQGPMAGQEANFTCRAKQNVSAKEDIARIAADLVYPGHAYYLDAGSTILTLTYFLHEGSYTVVTSAANTAAELAQKNRYNITLLGGQVSGVTLSCSGPQAEQMLDGMNIDVAIMAASGYSFSGGFTSGSLQEAQLKQRVIRKAACTMMLMDCGKIGRSHPFTFASLDDVDVLVGDSMLTPEFVREAEAHNVRVFSVNDGLTPEERSAIMKELFAHKYR